jgi:hypothetical protein
MAKGNQELVGGRFTHFGPRGLDAKRGEAVSRIGSVTELEYVFDWNDVPTFSATNEMLAAIPSGSIIERVVLVAIGAATSAASTDTFVVNAVRKDGTGGTVLLSTTRASLDALNKTVVGAGAGLNASLAGVTQIQVVPTAYTGGKFKLNVEYRAPSADVAGVKTY